MTYVYGRRGEPSHILIRGDAEGRLAIWSVPEVSGGKRKLARQESFENLPGWLSSGFLPSPPPDICIKLVQKRIIEGFVEWENKLEWDFIYFSFD